MEAIKAVAQQVRQAQRILFITGAGISADSGLPTYRGISGLYEENDTEDNLPIESVMAGAMLQTHPELTWKYLLQIENACRGARFNAGHKVIAQIEQDKPETWVLTQNVDGFHRAAGSCHVIEIHGNFSSLHCMACQDTFSVDDYSMIDANKHLPPRCAKCQGVMRPGVVLFGEPLPSAATAELEATLQRGFDMIFSIGTTSLFHYISYPVIRASKHNIPTVEINPAMTPVSQWVNYKFTSGAAETLTQLWACYQSG